jgi:hypothetical protein
MKITWKTWLAIACVWAVVVSAAAYVLAFNPTVEPVVTASQWAAEDDVPEAAETPSRVVELEPQNSAAESSPSAPLVPEPQDTRPVTPAAPQPANPGPVRTSKRRPGLPSHGMPGTTGPDDPHLAPSRHAEGEPVPEADPNLLKISGSRHNQDVYVHDGQLLELPQGEVTVSGNWTNDGKISGNNSTLVFDGFDQQIKGDFSARRIIMRGGTKRISNGTFGSMLRGDAMRGEAGLYIEEGTTLIIEKDAVWNVNGHFGFQVAGTLVIDGGEFHCRHSNGGHQGTVHANHERAWLPGSALVVYSGRFVGTGDANFDGAAITIYDGAIEINDDIWNAGASLTMHGGVFRNDTRGGAFTIRGTVQMFGGHLQIHDSGSRGLTISDGASLNASGGKVSINAVGRVPFGMRILGDAVLYDLEINGNNRIHANTPNGKSFTVLNQIRIAKGNHFVTTGYFVSGYALTGPEWGQWIQ